MGGVVVAEALLVLMFREDLTSGLRVSGLTGDTRTRRMLDPGSA